MYLEIYILCVVLGMALLYLVLIPCVIAGEKNFQGIQLLNVYAAIPLIESLCMTLTISTKVPAHTIYQEDLVNIYQRVQ